ncbi:MAG: tetratricopeptide repeat protein [Lentisphaerae bacterium]|nr:tetratricopeptide repeat protein [Lentisphaerota bacterium]
MTPQQTGGAPSPSAAHTRPWFVFFAALAVRLLYLWESSDTPTFFAPIIDAETYVDLARSALQTGHFSPAFFWQPFFYPAFLTAALAFGHGSLIVAKLLQAILGAGTCVLTFDLARRFLPRPWPLVAGLATAFYGPMIFYDGELLGTGWEAFWAPALILCLLDAATRPSLRRWFTLGLAAALSSLSRPTFIPFLAVATAWAAWSLWRQSAIPLRRLSHVVLALTAGLLLPLLPVSLLSHHVTGSLSILPYSGGLNLYIGNNPDSDHTVAIRPGYEWDNLTLLPARYGIAPGRETSDFFSHQALAYAKSQPLPFIRGMFRKTVQFLSPRELPRNEDLYLYRDWSLILKTLVWRAGPVGFPFALLLPLAAYGLYRRWRDIPAPIRLFLALYPAAVILVFVSARYRIPVIPVLAVCATAGAAALVNDYRATPRRLRVIAPLMLILVIVTSVPGPFPQERGPYRAEMYYCLGARQSRLGNNEEACRLLKQAVALQPGYDDALNSLGVAFERLERDPDAIANYRLAIDANPRNVTARSNLASALYRTGNFPGATTQFRVLSALTPRNAAVRNQLAMSLIRQNQSEAAIPIFYEALEIDPNDAAVHNNLGSALNGQGRAEEAIQHFEAAIVLNPDLDLAIQNLGAMLVGHGHPEQARILYRAALERAANRHDPARTAFYRRQLASLGVTDP